MLSWGGLLRRAAQPAGQGDPEEDVDLLRHPRSVGIPHVFMEKNADCCSVLALTYGRPMMIHPIMTRNRLCLPQAIDDEYLTGLGQEPGQQPSGTLSLMGCYIEAVRLQDIIGQFLAPINHVGFQDKQDAKGREHNTSEWYEKGDLDLKAVHEIDRLLDDWLRKLPVHLRFQTYRKGQGLSLNQDEHRLPLLERQANVLSARYDVFLVYVSISTTSKWEQPLIMESKGFCTLA